ncbi:MAG: uncharacterized protein QOF79_2289 [Actinomycetota bacterium]|nr:uncharacterized protein [Actinomycetota bacterium]
MTQSAAAAIRDARMRAQMSQTELAARASMAQSVVSAYESSRREPSVEMLRKLVGAAGFELQLELTPSKTKSPLQTVVDQNRLRLVRSLSKLGARNVRLFGSVARGDDGPESDIDLLVDINSNVGLFALGQMRGEAERILANSVDIVPANSLKPDVADRVLAEAIPL